MWLPYISEDKFDCAFAVLLFLLLLERSMVLCFFLFAIAFAFILLSNVARPTFA